MLQQNKIKNEDIGETEGRKNHSSLFYNKLDNSMGPVWFISRETAGFFITKGNFHIIFSSYVKYIDRGTSFTTTLLSIYLDWSAPYIEIQIYEQKIFYNYSTQ